MCWRRRTESALASRLNETW